MCLKIKYVISKFKKNNNKLCIIDFVVLFFYY